MVSRLVADDGHDVIAYNLACAQGHEFEGWFQNSKAYDSQAKTGALVCPICGNDKIAKAIMAPAVTGTSRAKGSAEAKRVRQYMTGLRKFIETNADYVGPKFPEEARKIHYGETEERHIYGESTLAQAKDMIEEGIRIAPMPPDPDELN
jgi:hypothetical protein